MRSSPSPSPPAPPRLDAARTLAQQSRISPGHLVLVDRHTTYAHNDPNSATPSRNDFFRRLIPFLAKVQKGH